MLTVSVGQVSHLMASKIPATNCPPKKLLKKTSSKAQYIAPAEVNRIQPALHVDWQYDPMRRVHVQKPCSAAKAWWFRTRLFPWKTSQGVLLAW